MRVPVRAPVALLTVAVVAAACSGAATTAPPAPTATPGAATATPAGSAAATSAASAGPTVDPSAAAAALNAVCAKGVTEGAVTVWIDIDPDLWAAETAPFTAQYPQIKVTQTSVRPTDSVPKVITDVTAGHAPETDIVQGEAALLDPLVQRGLIDTSFDWASYGQPADEVLNGMLRHYVSFRGLGYNTQTVQASDLPDTWDQLIDPKWAGQIMVDPRGYLFEDLGVAWGEQKTVDYVTNLKATDQPVVLKGITDDLTAVASGQAKLNTNARDAETAQNIAKGAPVGIKYLDYIPEDASYNAVVKGALHPNAGACLVAWLNSQEGLALQYQNEFKRNSDDPPEMEPGAQIIKIDTPAKASLDAQVGTDVANIWAGQPVTISSPSPSQ